AWEGRKHAIGCLHEHDARSRWIERAKLTRETVLGQLGDRAGQFHAGRTAADDDEGKPGPPLRFVLTALRGLEGKQKTAANVERVIVSFEAWRCRCPIVVAEIAVPRTRGDDQEVICKPRLAERDLTQHRVYPGHFAQQHAHVGWVRNISR